MWRIALFVLVMVGMCAMAAPPASRPATPAVAPDQNSPRGTVKLFTISIQSGDSAKVLACLKANSDLEERFANGYVDVTIGMGKLRNAVKAKFGEEAARAWGAQAGLAEIDAAKEEINGDTAVVRIAGDQPLALELLKDGVNWKISVAKMLAGKKPEETRSDIRKMQMIGKAASETAGEVDQGEFKKAADVITAFKAKLAKAAQGG
jgi:hypothetical protein